MRAHILEGLLKALDAIDEVIAIIRSSQTTDTAAKNLMKRLQLSEIQAQAILDMPLKRLAALERRKIADEHKEKLKEIQYLRGLLRSPAKIRSAIREELVALKARFGDARRTRIVAQEKGDHTAHDLLEAEEAVVTVWRDGQISRTAGAPALGLRGGSYRPGVGAAPATMSRYHGRRPGSSAPDSPAWRGSGQLALQPDQPGSQRRAGRCADPAPGSGSRRRPASQKPS